MVKQAAKIFESQTTGTFVEVINSYGCESMTLQVKGSGSFQLIISGRTNPKYDYQKMSAITDDFGVVSTITSNGVYSLGIGGRGSIKVELISVSGSVDCYANLF